MKHVMLASLLAASSARAAPVGTKVELDRTVARVGTAVVWESDVAARVKAGAARAAAIDGLIDDELELAEGRNAGVTVERRDVLAALDEIKRQNNLDDAALDKVLAESGFTRARYLVDLERQLALLRTRNLLIATQVQIEDAAVMAELKARNLPATSKDAVETELRRAAIDKLRTAWLAKLRKRAFIARRP